MGGVAAAVEVYHSQPTPNVIILETDGDSDILEGLDQLATVCDPGTRVVVFGQPNDTAPYRELVRRGVNDYVIGPVETLDVVRAICSLFAASEAIATGRIIAMVGAKGGVGASTVAHNVAWAIARDLALDSVVIDLDLAFGTAGLDYNQDPLQGIANAVFQPDRPDTALMERLLAKCSDNLSLLAAPATLERVYDFREEAFDAIFDTLRMTTPCIVLDIPHQWSAWTKRALSTADDILVVAEPDLANMRNAKNILNVLKATRPNDRPPVYCLNQVGMPKRPEIDVARIRQGNRKQADRDHSLQFADVRHRREQRSDDRADLSEPPPHQDLPAHRATTDGSRRYQEAAPFAAVADPEEAEAAVTGGRRKPRIVRRFANGSRVAEGSVGTSGSSAGAVRSARAFSCATAAASDRPHSRPLPRAAGRPSRCFRPRQGGPAGRAPAPD